LIDIQAAIEKERLDFYDKEQKRLRVEKYQHLQDLLAQDDLDPATISQTKILPFSFISGNRFMQQLF
jgi:hypothetical protein